MTQKIIMSKEQDIYNTHEIVDFYKITTQTQSKIVCGLDCWRYEFDSKYGEGYYQAYHFDGLYIGIFNAFFNRNIQMKGVLNENIFELSFLLSGEILVNVTGVEHNIVYEEQECYMLYLPKVAGSIKYNKHQPIKEIRFRMDERFIKKHKIDKSVNIYEIYDLMYQNAHFLFPITPEKQHVLNEILEDTQVGLAKRLFLESQCLKLIALQLQNILSQEGGIKNKGILKKLIEVQNIIGKDLSKQYSLNELSRIIGVNELMLKKEFKKRFGMTIFQYTTELKMEEAIKLYNLFINISHKSILVVMITSY